jgi:zinc transporter ZupT
VTVSRVTLPDDGTIVLHVTNNGPEAVSIEQVLVEDAYWEFALTRNGEPIEGLAPARSGQVRIPYHWNPGWDLGVALVLEGGATVHHDIIAPQPAPGLTGSLLGTLVVVGLLVGVIPIALGMLWFPFMRDLSDRWLDATLLFAAGVLAFLAVDAGFEAFAVAAEIPGAYEGPLLVAVAIAGAALLVQAVGEWGGGDSPLALAYLVALGIGLHNLAEGLAIGGAIGIGRLSLGAFLVIGFMIHNVTEGPAVVAPLADERRPALWHFLALGTLAGAPVILGGVIGSAVRGPTLGAVLLAVGVGAILQVDGEIVGMVRERGRLGTATNLLAFLAGLAVMYATDLLVTV